MEGPKVKTKQKYRREESSDESESSDGMINEPEITGSDEDRDVLRMR